MKPRPIRRICLDCRERYADPRSKNGSRCRQCEQERNAARNRHPTRQPIRTNQWNQLPRGGTCWICGQPGADTLDHLTPRHQGGTTTPENLQPAHRACNSARTTTPQQPGGAKWPAP